MKKSILLIIMVTALVQAGPVSAKLEPDTPSGGGTGDAKTCYVTCDRDSVSCESLRKKFKDFENSNFSLCKGSINLTKGVELTSPLIIPESTKAVNFVFEGNGHRINLSKIDFSKVADGCAIKIAFNQTATFRNVTFTGARLPPESKSKNPGKGVCVTGNNKRFENVKIEDNNIGMIVDATNVTVINSEIRNNTVRGIELKKADQNEITSNIYSANGPAQDQVKSALGHLTSPATGFRPSLSAIPGNVVGNYKLNLSFKQSANRAEIYRVGSGDSANVTMIKSIENTNNQFLIKVDIDHATQGEKFFALGFLNKSTSAPSDILTLSPQIGKGNDDGNGPGDPNNNCPYHVINPSGPGVIVPRPDCVNTVGSPDPCSDVDGDGILDNIEDADRNCRRDPGETDSQNSDSDDDKIIDGYEDHNLNGKFEEGETDPRNNDTDDDNLDDGLEDKNQNGVTEDDETDPKVKDTDGDGVDDDKEIGLDGVYNAGKDMDATDPDTDDDGLEDGAEDLDADGVFDFGETNPLLQDSDDDGEKDGEDICPLDPTPDCSGGCDIGQVGCISNCVPGQKPPANLDTDKDGLADGREDANYNCMVDKGESDPQLPDTDGDGLNDFLEKRYGTDPQNQDHDGDNILDGAEDRNKNGFHDSDECDAKSKDTDRDGIEDDMEDRDRDGLVDQEVSLDIITTRNPSCTGESKCYERDSDGDGIIDGDEDKNHNGVYDAGETCAISKDTDGDGAADNLDRNPLRNDPHDLDNILGRDTGCALHKGLPISARPAALTLSVFMMGLIFIVACLKRRVRGK